jgi:hypothetical protein
VKSIAVHIKEIDKGDKQLTLQNLRDEVVGFLYRDTIARSTRGDMQFYILLFFIAVPNQNRTSLEVILDEGLPKFDRLTQAFNSKRGYLRANEYHELVIEYELTGLFYKDLFFVICDGVLNLPDIEHKFADLISEDAALRNVITRLKRDYIPRIESSFEVFRESRIQDDRYDEYGNYHDLSKSVYRTVRMRSAKNLELNLQKYTAIKKIESNSPIDITFLQNIDPQILIELWDKYHVTNYMVNLVKEGWQFANEDLPATAIGEFIAAYLIFKRLNGRENPKEKRAAKNELIREQRRHNKYIERLNVRLVDSVLESNARLKADIDALKRERKAETQKNKVIRDEASLKNLTGRIERLENLQIETKLKEKGDDDPQSKLL